MIRTLGMTVPMWHGTRRMTHFEGTYNFKMSFVCAHEHADPNPGAMIAMDPAPSCLCREKLLVNVEKNIIKKLLLKNI
jgi:hypothetical protein